MPTRTPVVVEDESKKAKGPADEIQKKGGNKKSKSGWMDAIIENPELTPKTKCNNVQIVQSPSPEPN
jgi:hypothetical protein